MLNETSPEPQGLFPPKRSGPGIRAAGAKNGAVVRKIFPNRGGKRECFCRPTVSFRIAADFSPAPASSGATPRKELS